MQILQPAVTCFHDVRRKKKSGLYPVKIRLTHARIQKYYATGLDLSEPDFQLLMNPSLMRGLPLARRRELQEIKLRLDVHMVRIQDVIRQMHRFNFEEFDRLMNPKARKAETLYSLFEALIAELREAGRLGTADNYLSSLNSIKRFRPKLDFREVRPAMLNDFEAWLLTQGRSISTVGIYLRPLRVVLNRAIELGYLSKDDYPFGKRRYQIPASKNVKKALSIEEISTLYRAEVIPGTWYEKAKDYWFFSYFANGMNVKDMALLQQENLDGEYLRFVRAKTQRTNRSGSRMISVHVTDELREILRRHAQTESPYLFPILQKGMDLDKQDKAIAQCIKMVNQYIRLLAQKAGIDKNITTYTARHSFATILKRKGISTELISESLGHSSLSTTSSYLDSFEDEAKKKISQALLPT